MSGEKPSVEVAAGVIWQDGRFLAAKRPEGKSRSGFWEFPGGKREQDESMLDALRRELREELGIECGRIVPWEVVAHDYSDMRVELHFMHVASFTGVPQANDGQELRWVTPEEARALPFLPADVAVVERIRRPEL